MLGRSRFGWIALLLLLVVAAGAQAADTTFKDRGVLFVYPGDWKVEQDVSELGDISYVLITADSPGSAFVSIAVYSQDMGLTKTVDEFRDGLKQNFESFGNVVSEPYSETFANTQFSGYRLTVKALGIPHTNHVVGALINGRTVVVSWQYADEDLAQFGPQIERIKGTLQVSK